MLRWQFEVFILPFQILLFTAEYSGSMAYQSHIKSCPRQRRSVTVMKVSCDMIRNQKQQLCPYLLMARKWSLLRSELHKHKSFRAGRMAVEQARRSYMLRNRVCRAQSLFRGVKMLHVRDRSSRMDDLCRCIILLFGSPSPPTTISFCHSFTEAALQGKYISLASQVCLMPLTCMKRPQARCWRGTGSQLFSFLQPADVLPLKPASLPNPAVEGA